MLTLYDNPFSPFARKARMALDFKGLAYRSVDALALDRLGDLARVNPRAEVPALEDDGFVVVNSSEILAYLEDRFPEPPLMPEGARGRAEARRWQRLADTTLDAVVHAISIWTWPTHRRADAPPEGLLEAGRRELRAFADGMEAALGDRPFLCGALSVADLAVFPHATAFKLLGAPFDPERCPRALAWFKRMRGTPAAAKDLEHVRRMGVERFGGPHPYESEKIVWRGDRIEWLLAAGFDDWWGEERRAGRAVVRSGW